MTRLLLIAVVELIVLVPSAAAWNELGHKVVAEIAGRQLVKTDIFVATYSALRDEKTGSVTSYCTWSEGVDCLLPETEQVVFFRPQSPEDGKLAARGDWNTVRSVAGYLMEPQGLYPERWRVREFPSEEVLKRIANHSSI
jgi:hypothetical protein